MGHVMYPLKVTSTCYPSLVQCISIHKLLPQCYISRIATRKGLLFEVVINIANNCTTDFVDANSFHLIKCCPRVSHCYSIRFHCYFSASKQLRLGGLTASFNQQTENLDARL